jgi:hypothetical protein
MTQVDELLARIGDDRGAPHQVSTLFAEWWSTRDERAQLVLDRLALDAASSTDSLDLLLELVDRHGISRPALRRILISADDLDEAEQSTLAVVAMKVQN